MCGICGVFGGERVSRDLILKMTRSLSHRGPDDEGIALFDSGALGHRRLSIIDLEGGRQPIGNEDGRLSIIFNGEIYNYLPLRKRLQEQGHRFQTLSDTETILHLYEDLGSDCLQFLRGMFALAIWDDEKETLFLARDHLGQKPLYYCSKGETLAFASEIKALLVADPTLHELDSAALLEYLTLRQVAPPRSMFARVKKLPPAHYLIHRPGESLQIERYWSPPFEPKLQGTDEEILEELERRLTESLSLHLVSDVPVGAFLSSGFDSTLNVAMMMRNRLADRLDTFSIGVPYGDFDEAPGARLVARVFGTSHHERTVVPSLLDSLPRLVLQLDEPSDTLPVCVDLLAQLASSVTKVVIGGDGGDELFGGYDRYYGYRHAEYYSALPHRLRRHVLQPILDKIPDGSWYRSVAHQAKWLHELSFFEGSERYLRGLGYFYVSPPYQELLFGPELERAAAEFEPGAGMRRAFEEEPDSPDLDKMLRADYASRLPDHSVMILDRITMAYGLEARSPLMDHKLVEFAAQLPERLKIRGRARRYAQLQLARKYLPRDIHQRRKQGFASALPYLLKDELDVLHRCFLENMQLAEVGLVTQAGVDALLRSHRHENADHGNRLWLLLNAEIWFRMFLAGQTPSQVAAEIESAKQGQLSSAG